MVQTSQEDVVPSEADVAREWSRRAARGGLARVMRASQPEELNVGVTRETERVLRELAEIASHEAGGPLASALEIGCGVGRLTPTIAAHAGRVTAVDMTDEMLENARRNCSWLNTVDFVAGRAEDRPWGQAMFDLAVSVWVLMHVLDERQLEAVCRSIAESSRYLILVEYQKAAIPVSRWSRLRTVEEYLALMPGARLLHGRALDYGGDLSFAALVRFER